MEIKPYSEEYFNDIFDVTHKTIEEVYTKYYPRSAVDFFHEHHSRENMMKQLPNEFTLILLENSKVIGTGTLFENEIKRLFILPDYQGKGNGKKLLKALEDSIDTGTYENYYLNSSLGAVNFYMKNGYVYKSFMTINLPDGNNLYYLDLVKNIIKK